MKRFTVPLLLTIALATGCARREEAAEDSATTEPVPNETAADRSVAEAPAPKIVAGVDVEIALSPAAEAELKKRSETIVVEATYAGDPTAESSTQTDEFGLVQLGSESRELSSPGKLRFDEGIIDKSRLSMISGQPQLLINVRSGKKSVQNNLLACPLFWNSVAAASRSVVRIDCQLLSELPPEA